MLLAFVIMATFTFGMLFTGWLTPLPVGAQQGTDTNTPPPSVETTNCVQASSSGECLVNGSISLVAPTNSPLVCMGSAVSLSATYLVSTGLVEVTTTYTNAGNSGADACPNTTTNVPSIPGIASATWDAHVGSFSTNGTGLTAAFTPTDCGSGTVYFHLSYSNSAPCDTSVTGAPDVQGGFTVYGFNITDSSGKSISSANSNNVVIVGQYIGLTMQTCGSTFSNFQWKVDGYAISNYDIVNGILYADFPLTNSWVGFHWVDGGSKQVSCSADSGGFQCSTNVNFTVVKPTAKINAKTSSVIFTPVGSGGMLKFGGFLGQGITFSNTITVPSNFSGTSVWSQVCASAPVFTITDTSGVTHTTVQNGSSPFGDLPSPYGEFNGVNPYDSPSLEILSPNVGGSAAGSYEMFMMFQPPGGCPVPLRAVTWSWSAIVTKNSGQWSGASTNSIDPPDYSTTSFPTWNSSLKAFHWDPQF